MSAGVAKSIITVTRVEGGNLSVQMQGNLSPAEIVLAVELIKDKILHGNGPDPKQMFDVERLKRELLKSAYT